MNELETKPTRHPGWDLELGEPAKRMAMAYPLRLITPMIGGGAVPGQPDKHNAIRPSAIRGHLRFWWRALQADRGAVRVKEDRIWGSDEKHGRVSIRVEVVKTGDVKLLHQTSEAELPKYVKGVLVERRDVRDEDRLRVLTSAEFILTLAAGAGTSEADFDEAKRAVEAWIAFGGLGARVRRGAGALGTPNLSKTSLNGLLGATPSQAMGLTTLQGATLYLTRPCRKASDAYRAAVTVYEGFRKGFRADQVKSRMSLALGGQQPNPYESHHSPWPEADSIRAIRGERQLHPRDLGSKLHLPRARLGMPLTIRMMPSHTGFVRPGQFDTVNAAGQVRLASPVIVKAIQIGNEYCGAILILKQPFRAEVVSLSNVSADITFQPTQPPVGMGLAGTKDVRDLFMQFLDQLGLERVKA